MLYKKLVTKKTKLTLVLAVSLILMAACSSKSDDESVNISEQAAESSSVSLVNVNNTDITDAEFSLAVQRTLGKNAALYMNEELEKKLLESLITSRAIAQKSESEMDKDDLVLLELKTKAYREELLVKSYLERHITPQPVTTEMVKKYYLENSEAFGGGVVKHFEYVQLVLPKGEDSSLAVAPITQIINSNDWQKASRLLEKQRPDWQLSYKKASLKAELIKEPLNSLVSKVAVGEVAPLKFEDGVYTLLRLNDEKVLPVKPLAEVSADIRKTLAPIQLKKSVRQISDAAIKQAKISRN